MVTIIHTVRVGKVVVIGRVTRRVMVIVMQTVMAREIIIIGDKEIDTRITSRVLSRRIIVVCVDLRIT